MICPKTLLVNSIDSRAKEMVYHSTGWNERIRKLLRRDFNDDPRRKRPDQRGSASETESGLGTSA
jgi:hypothetical protein